jgi:hypothetical protein
VKLETLPFYSALVYTSIIGVGASLVAFGIAALAVDVSRSGYF